jgi:hypothetical protein
LLGFEKELRPKLRPVYLLPPSIRRGMDKSVWTASIRRRDVPRT